jgi:hypothetical protein
MQPITAHRLFAAALVTGTLLSAPVQAQSSELSTYKLLVDTTLVLGSTTEDGLMRVLNNGPASAEVRWFDPKAGDWDSQLLEAGESLLSERGHTVRVSQDTLVCLLGQAASSKDKAGYRGTNGFYSLPMADEKPDADSKDDASKSKPPVKTKPEADDDKAKEKPASKSKPPVKTRPEAESKDDPSKK